MLEIGAVMDELRRSKDFFIQPEKEVFEE